MSRYLLAASALLVSASAAFAAPQSYQVSGQVLELSKDKIVISKGKENWALLRDAKTKLPETVKVGSKITIEYSMIALDVTDKTTPEKPKEPKEAKDKDTKDKAAAAKAGEVKTATEAKPAEKPAEPKEKP